MSHEGKLYTITGAASGIALATATLLAKQGALLSLADYHEGNLKKAETELSGLTKKENLLFTVVDIRSTLSVDEWIAATTKHFGRTIDGCANIAGTRHAQAKGIAAIPDEEFLEIMDVNTTGALRCLRAQVQPGVLSASASLVTITSLLGHMGAPDDVAYCASKHATTGIVKRLAKEVVKRGVRVNAVAPGFTDTPLAATSGLTETYVPIIGMGRAAEPSEIAEGIIWLLSPQASYVTGTVLHVGGGLGDP